MGAESTQGLGIVVSVAPLQAEKIIDDQPQTKSPTRDAIPAVVCHQETHGRNQSLPLAQQQLALADRLQGDSELGIAQVAEASMDHLGGAAGGPGAEVVSFKKQSTQSGAHRFAQDARSSDPAADDDQVPCLREAIPCLLTPCARAHRRSAFRGS